MSSRKQERGEGGKGHTEHWMYRWDFCLFVGIRVEEHGLGANYRYTMKDVPKLTFPYKQYTHSQYNADDTQLYLVRGRGREKRRTKSVEAPEGVSIHTVGPNLYWFEKMLSNALAVRDE